MQRTKNGPGPFPRILTAALLLLAALAAAFAFSEPTQAQQVDDSLPPLADLTIASEYLQPSLNYWPRWWITVKNDTVGAHPGTYIRLVKVRFTISDPVRGDTTSTRTIRDLPPGDSVRMRIDSLRTLPAATDGPEKVPQRMYAEIIESDPVELPRFRFNNATEQWAIENRREVGGSAGVTHHTNGDIAIDVRSISERLPRQGGATTFTVAARIDRKEIPGVGSDSRDDTLFDVQVEISLSRGLSFAANQPEAPAGTTLDTTTGIWNMGASTPARSTKLLQVAVNLTADSLADLPLEERCLTAKLVNAVPWYANDPLKRQNDTATACLGKELLSSGSMDLIDYYPCIGVTDYPCTSEDTVELVVARNLGNQYEFRQPESVIVHVPDPDGRFSKNGSLVWSTVNLMDLRMTQTRLTSDWSIRESVKVTAPGGGDAPGRWLLTNPDDTNNLDLLDAMDSSTVTYDFFDLSDIGTDPAEYIFNFKVDFWALGTYEALIGSFARLSGTTYTDSGTYIFHVGPVAELEVRDGDSGLAPAGTRAFTIVAVNNGPDDAPAAQVTVSGLNVGDYVSHSATAGTFDSTSGVWTIGELRETGYLQDVYGRDGEVLTIITSAAVDTEITAAITNTQDYQVCIDSSNDDVDLSSPSETACTTEDSTNTWHTAKYYDYVSDNDSATIKARGSTGADLPSLQGAQFYTASIVVTWDAETELNGRPVTHYEVQRQTNAWVTVADNVTGTAYVDTDVEAGDTFQYRIRAVNDWDHKGPWSAPMEGTVPLPATAGAPEAPVLTSSLPDGASGRRQIDLAWDKPVENGSPITSYTLEVSDGRNGPWAEPTPAPQLGASDTSWSHTGLTGGTRKYYRIKATNTQGDSLWSAVIEATTRAPGKAGPPLSLSAAPDGDSAIDLSWDPPVDDGGSPIRYYEVQWSANGTSAWRNAGRTADAVTRTFKNTGMSFGTTRYYRVAARNGVTLGDWSDPPASATTLAGVPGRPNLTARATDANTITLTWTVPADNGSAIIRYELEHSPDGSDGSWISLTSPGAADTSYSDTGLDPGTLRYYRIRAVNGATPGEGSWSTVRSATTPPAVPGAPTLRAEANGQNAIDVIWEPPFDDGGADITGYELHWSADGAENSYARLTSPSASARSYTHSNLQPGTTRYYQLRARNRAGLGEFSFPASATTLTGVPAAPSLTARANGATEIKLSWTKPDDRGSDILLYHLQQSDDGNDWYFLGGSISASDTEYVHTGLSGGTTKHYRIRAGNGNGDGQWSATRNARTDAGGPDAPVLTLTVVGDNQIDLSWTEPANNGSAIRGYWVERSSDGNEPWERLTSNNRTRTYSDDDLYRGMTRHYRVAAFNSAGTGPYSDAKSATTTGTPATAPGDPTLVRLSSVGRSEVTLAWDAPTDDGGAPVTGYEYEAAVPCEDDPNTPENESESNCGFTEEDIRTTTGTSARITGLTTDGDYDFRVRAINLVGKGEWVQGLQTTLRPSTSGQVRVSPTTITVNEGATVTYTIRLSTAPPHPVQAFIQPQGNGGYNDIEEAAFEYNQSLLTPSGWTHPDPDEAPYWTDFSYNWNQGVRVTFTAPEDSDTDDEVALIHHFVIPLPYDHYRPCRQETQAERDQCKQDWEDAWADSPYRQLTGASVKIIVRDND